MDEPTDNSTKARQAYAAQDWATAASHFDAFPPERCDGSVKGRARSRQLCGHRLHASKPIGLGVADRHIARSRLQTS